MPPEASRRECGSSPSHRRRRGRSPSPSSKSYSSDSDSRSFSTSSRSRSLSYSPSPPPRRSARDEDRRTSRYEVKRRPERVVQRRRTRDDEDGYDRYERRRGGDGYDTYEDTYERRRRSDETYEGKRRDDSRERRRRDDGFERGPRDDIYERRPREDVYDKSSRTERYERPRRNHSLEARRRREEHDRRDTRHPDVNRYDRRRDNDRHDRRHNDDRYDRRGDDDRYERRRDDRFRARSRSASRSPPSPRERGGSYREAPHGDYHDPRPPPRSLPPPARKEPRLPARRPLPDVPMANGHSGVDGAVRRRAWLEEDERAAKAGESMWQRRQRMRERAAGRVEVWDVSPEPPKKLEDRFEVGADERKKKARKRKRKDERRARREAKRARKAGVKAEEEKSTDGAGTAKVGPEGTVNGGIEKMHREERGPRLAPVDEDDEDEDGVIGPPLPTSEKDSVGKNVDYGKALRPGEGSKMAAFVQDGVRIPRRGEIGLTSDQIESFESQGYVMSGNRNRRMEAVRIRKENQIYTAEELAALSQFSHEERKLREERVLNQFRVLVESKLGDGGGDKVPDVGEAGEDVSARRPPRAPFDEASGK